VTLRAGIDIVEVGEIEHSIRVHANRYLERVYTLDELRDCRGADGAPDARRLATRFAAKEATLKALGSGEEALPWRSIEVVGRESALPAVALKGAAESLARVRGVTRIDLSVTHAGPYVAAVALAWSDERR
jgi:holo-[acyl-carrier protein] synthase